MNTGIAFYCQALKMTEKKKKISRYFSDRDTNCILAIPLGIRAPEDCINWAFTDNGVYSFKTAYIFRASHVISARDANEDVLFAGIREVAGLQLWLTAMLSFLVFS